MKKVTYLVCCVGLALQSCQSGQVKNENPFFNTYETPHEVPPFHLIKNQHYLPAYEEGMKQHQAEIDAIINNPEAPTFKNTIDALETSGELLNKVASVFGNQQGANTNDSIKAIAKEITPKLTAHWDAINLNDKLFERIKTVYNNKEKENLTPEQLTVLDKYYQGFVRGGANLSPEDKETFKKLNSELSMLSLQFGENLLNETNNFKLVIDNEKDLSGLPENVIATAATAAKNAGLEGKWVFTLHNPSMIPFLQYADNRDLREKSTRLTSTVAITTTSTITKKSYPRSLPYEYKKPSCSVMIPMRHSFSTTTWPKLRRTCTTCVTKSGMPLYRSLKKKPKNFKT